MRQRETLRGLIRETRFSAEQLVMPLFVRPGKGVRAAIPSMPGQFQLSADQLVQECQQVREQGVPAVLLFGLPAKKDEKAGGAYARDGVIQEAVRAVKARVPELLVMTDVCLCAYMSHGHCGVVKSAEGRRPKAEGKHAKRFRSPASGLRPPAEREYWIDNDATLELIAKTAVSHAQAGADVVAPSDMMDHNVGAVREALDRGGFGQVPIMAYAVKYASAFYGPFREAVESAPRFGDRRSYQMDPANAEEALREAALDIEQGADLLMVKPALAYLDVIRRLKETFRHPVAAFSVSGEYAMVKAAAARGWVAERPAWLEILLGIKRAGADLIITYWAKEAAKLLREQ
jgi:porphobilinogen synthase